jgi:hypothetical protein
MIEGTWIFDTEWTSHRERIAKKIRKAMKYYNERPDPKLLSVPWGWPLLSIYCKIWGD